MARKKEDNKEDIRSALKNHKIPILTLDVRWHSLFPDYEKTSKMKSLERELNNLLKKQGKLSTDNKEMKKLKKRLMNEIVENMEAAEEGRGTRLQEKKVDSSQKLILEINDKMKNADQELLEIPGEIQRVNRELMIEGMQTCYDTIQENTERMKELSGEIKEIREKLQQKLLEKNDREMKTDRIYTYMHALLGPGVMEILDRQRGITRIRRDMEEAESLSKFAMSSYANNVKNGGVSSSGEDGEEDPDAPAGTGNRIPRPIRGAVGDKSRDSGTNQAVILNRVKTKAQEQSEQEKKRQNLVKEFMAQPKEEAEDFMEERKQKLKERKTAIRKRKGSLG